MAELLTFLILISAGLFFSGIFRKFHLPYAVALILCGILIGPYGLDIFISDTTTDFLGELGLIFLMFMAGLETKFSTLEKLKKSTIKLSLLNSIIPFLAGVGIATYFGYELIAALLLGSIFISSSIAIIIPSLGSKGLMNSRLGQTIVSTTIFGDILSLVVFSILLQTIKPITSIPLVIFYLMIFFFILLLRILIPRLEKFFFIRKKGADFFERELRFILAVLVGTAIFFEIMGMHAIIAGFFVGLTLSESIKNKITKEKLHTISYGLLIPTFFIVLGSKTDIGVLFSANGALLLVAAVVIGSVLSKFLSGFVGGKLIGFDSIKSAIIGSSTIPQLSTTLAVAFIGLELGILDQNIITAMIILSLVTTFVGPLLVNLLVNKLRESN